MQANGSGVGNDKVPRKRDAELESRSSKWLRYCDELVDASDETSV